MQVTIQGSRAPVRAVMTNFENASQFISGIDKVQVLERPASGVMGQKWRETRMLFGRPADEDQWITEARENEFYKTGAESPGFVYLSTTSISEGMDGVSLTSIHETRAETVAATIMSIPMVLFFRGVARRALLQDLKGNKIELWQPPAGQ